MVTMPFLSESITSSNSFFLSRTQSSSMSWACWFSTVPTGKEMNSDSVSFLSPSWSKRKAWCLSHKYLLTEKKFNENSLSIWWECIYNVGIFAEIGNWYYHCCLYMIWTKGLFNITDSASGSRQWRLVPIIPVFPHCWLIAEPTQIWLLLHHAFQNWSATTCLLWGNSSAVALTILFPLFGEVY